MSREDACAFVDHNRVTCGLFRHTHVVHNIGHIFVEPTRAEAPQEETGRICVKCGGTKIDRQGRECRYCSWKPAAQPETGGDEARVLAEAFLAQHEKRLDDFCYSAGKGEYGAGQIDYVLTDLVVDAVRFARAAENEACEKLAAHEVSIGTGTAEFIAIRIRDAIAKRRGSGT